MEIQTTSAKGLLGKAKDAVLERLMGAEQSALAAITNAQNEVIGDIRAAKESAKTSAQSASELAQKAAAALTGVENGSKRIAELGDESSKLMEAMRAKGEEAKASQVQAQSTLKAVETADAEAKAHVKEIVGAKAEIKNQLTEIGQFYSEIGERKAELLDLKKNTATDLSKMSEGFSASLDDYKSRTENIVKQNEAMGEEIRSHLQRAVGASLFSAFGTRKDKIVIGKWLWFAAFVLSMVGGFLWINFMIHELKGTLDTAFVVRTAFGVLIGYFVYFCSRQYDRERRAEEEYAFKAAVSVSLKPFHDLLIDSKSKEIDADFMKRLMAQIFENPVTRLFNEGKSTSKLEINGKGLSGEHSVEPPRTDT